MATLHASRPCAGGEPENYAARLPTHPGADEAIKKGAKEFGVQRGVAELKKTRIRNTPVLQACFDPLFDPLGSIGPSAAGSTAGDYQL